MRNDIQDISSRLSRSRERVMHRLELECSLPFVKSLLRGSLPQLSPVGAEA